MSDKGRILDKDVLPVEELSIPVKNSGVLLRVKALDKYWVEDRTLSVYEHPPTDTDKILGAADLWHHKMTDYLDDVRWLLAMEHHKFWSTVIFHPQCMDMLVSFLQEANPPYMPPYESDIQALYQDIRKSVFLVFSRLITNKESKSQHMSKEYMRDLIYDKFIFTIPIVWDICLVYGADNPQHVARLLDSLFLLQPKYLKDLEAAILFVKEAFKYTTLQVNKDYESPEPPNLPQTFAGFSDIKRPVTLDKDTLTPPALMDLVMHLLDTILTLRIFVSTYPKSVEIFRKKGFVLSIVRLYEFAIPYIYEKVEELECSKIISKQIQDYLDMVRAELIDMFREILATYKNTIFNGGADAEKAVENYLSVMMEGLSENLFMKDYHACYPVDEDIQILRQVHTNIDTVKTDFILQAIYANLDEPDKPKPQKLIEQPNLNNNTIVNGNLEPTENRPGPSHDPEIPDKIKEESLISEVKDILPHLGDGFIQKCLKYYDFKTERVINSVLEDTLADCLRGVDKTLPIIPEDPLDKKFLETGVARLNVFDGDEFDIMTRDDVDLSRIHVGKRKSKNWKEVLDDKSDIKKRTDIYSKYNLICEDDRMYSDEYDDTYEDDGVAIPSGDVGDDLGRPFVVPRALQKPTPRGLVAESSSEDEVEESTAQNRRMDFCTNPEELRARREAWRNKTNKGPPPTRSTDVAGKPKGQGQEKDVLKNRDNKEKHKSSRSNHSRRKGAQWKRTQGMIPS